MGAYAILLCVTLTPLLSIAICTYNHAALLAETLDALGRQVVPDGTPWEVVVINNNCTDGTVYAVQEAITAGRIPELRLVRETRQGLLFARRAGVRMTRAPWVALLDDDVLPAPDWVSQAIATTAAIAPDVGAIGGRITLAWAREPSPFACANSRALAAQDLGHAPHAVDGLYTAWLVGAGLLLRRDALRATGWMERAYCGDRTGRTLRAGGDIEIGLRLRTAGYRLWYTPDLQMRHIIPTSRMTDTAILRLRRGNASAAAVLAALADGRTPTRRDGARVLRAEALQMVRALPHERADRARSVGTLAGAIDLLLHGPRHL